MSPLPIDCAGSAALNPTPLACCAATVDVNVECQPWCHIIAECPLNAFADALIVAVCPGRITVDTDAAVASKTVALDALN